MRQRIQRAAALPEAADDAVEAEIGQARRGAWCHGDDRLAGDSANLLSGSWHLAALTPPSAEATWAAEGLNVAVARLLQGHRDFVADVTEALRSNEAPEAVLARVRRLPVTRREELAPGAPDAARALETVLWLSWHEPKPRSGLGKSATASCRR